MLYGRSTAQAAVERLIIGSRDRRSGALVLRGEPGIGKSALLAWAAEVAAGTGSGTDPRVLRVTGIESESDLAFAGLVQLLWPVQDRVDAFVSALRRGMPAPSPRMLPA